MAIQLKINLFGTFRLSAGMETYPALPTRKSRELLAFLVTYPNRAHARSTLAGLLWPDSREDKARASLSTALWRLNKVLAVYPGCIEHDSEQIAFYAHQDVWVDTHVFERLVKQDKLAGLVEGTQIYQGDFLEGYYTDWCLRERQRLLDLYLQALEVLMRTYEARGENAQALSYAKQLVGYDELREEWHCALLSLYAALGDRPAALAHYQDLKSLLHRELGVEPLPATQRLYKQILDAPQKELEWNGRYIAISSKTRKILVELQRAKKYDPELFVARPGLDSVLDDFLGGSAKSMILIGPSGVGKSSWMADLAHQRLQQGDLVLFYACNSLNLNVERQLVLDLAGAPYLPMDDVLRKITDAAENRQQFVWLFFDGLNEFHDLDAGPADLLSRLDRLFARIEYRHLKVVISCRNHTWRQMKLLGRTGLHWGDVYLCQPLQVRAFSEQEFSRAYEKYRYRYGWQTRLQELPELLSKDYRTPLMLRLFAEVRQGRAVSKAGAELFLIQKYIEQVAPGVDAHRFLAALVDRFASQGKTQLPVKSLAADPELAWGLGENPNTPFQKLCDAGVLIETGPDLARQVRFVYDGFLEYLLARHFLDSFQVDSSNCVELVDLARQAWQFPHYWGTALNVLWISQQSDEFFQLAVSDIYEAQALAVEGLAGLYHIGEATLAIKIVIRLLGEGNANARRVVLRVASELGPPEKEQIYLSVASARDPAASRDLITFLFRLWKLSPHQALDVLALLVDEISLPTLLVQPKLLQIVVRMISWFSRYTLPVDVLDRIDQLVHRLAVQKLRLPRTGSSVPVVNLLQRIIAPGTTSWPVGSGILEEVAQAAELSAQERQAFRRILDELRNIVQGRSWVPSGNEHEQDLLILVGSKSISGRYLMMNLLAIWIHNDFSSAQPVLAKLFALADGLSRLLILLAFIPISAPAPQAFPESGLVFLENLTRQYAQDNAHNFRYGINQGYFLDLPPLSFLSLGLRYIQLHREDLPVIAEYCDQDQAVYLRLLTPLGWVKPELVLAFIARHTDFRLTLPVDTIDVLNRIWAVYPDLVEGWLVQVGADEALKRRMRMFTKVEQAIHGADFVSALDLCISSILLEAPYGHWVVDVLFTKCLENLTAEQAAQELGETYLQMLINVDWRVTRILGIR